MISTLTISHRQGNQPGRVRAGRGLAAQGCSRRLDVPVDGASYVVSPFTGTIPAMWTKCPARPLGTRST